MTSIPSTHIADAHSLDADAVIELFQLAPTAGGILYFKNGPDQTWQGQTYTGLPCTLSSVKRSSESAASQPRLSIGQPDINLSAFKPLIFDGYLDNAQLTYLRVLRQHIISNSDIKETKIYRVKRVESYSRSQVILGLSTASDAMQFTLPNLQYYPPDFPAVLLD